MRKLLPCLALLFLLLAGCPEPPSARDEIEFLTQYPLEENWERRQEPLDYYEGYCSTNAEPIANIVFSNPDLICKYTIMYGGFEAEPEYGFSFYPKGTNLDMGACVRGLAPGRIDTKNYEVYIFTPCGAEKFDFIEKLYLELEAFE
ncbi:MAG: hypothetical protein JW772_03005 [Candidatus Diapherotrites archaeon]|nr:hypothetical protein [Candidatus Diapherotrites archaeon]